MNQCEGVNVNQCEGVNVNQCEGVNVNQCEGVNLKASGVRPCSRVPRLIRRRALTEKYGFDVDIDVVEYHEIDKPVEC